MPRLIVFGVDGGTWKIIDPLIERGELPNFEHLKQQGSYGVLRSVEPIISPVIWTSIASGKVPGKHGVRDFVVSSKSVRCKRLWDIAEDNGFSVGMLGYLVTWPPRPISCFLIPGSFAQGPETFPPELSFLREMDMSERISSSRPQRYTLFAWKGLHHGLQWSTMLRALSLVLKEKLLRRSYLESFYEKRAVGFQVYSDVFSHLCGQYKPDIMIFVASLTDSTSHNYWKYLEANRYQGLLDEDEVKRHKDKVFQAYREVDRTLGRLLALRTEDTHFVVLSDHGFQSVLDEHSEPLDRVLQIKPEAIGRALKLPSNIRMFSLRGRAYFRDRSDDRQLEQQIAGAIASLHDETSGQPLFAVHQTNSYVEVALNPNIRNHKETNVVLPDANVWLGSEFVTGIGDTVSGVHHPDGIFLVSGPGIRVGERVPPASVLDITPTLLYLLDLPVGKDMDGNVMNCVLEPSLLKTRPVNYIESWEEPEKGFDSDTEELTETLVERLRALGYL